MKPHAIRILIIAFVLASGIIAVGGEIASIHSNEARDKLGLNSKSRSHEEVESTIHGITEIGIERTGCFGTCPAYTFTVKNDGSFRYMGEKFVERTGEFTGSVPVPEFNRLAQFIRDSGYMELEDSYTRSVTDNPTVFTMVVMNGKRRTVRNYANAGPTELWAIEQLIDDLMVKATWADSQNSGKKKK